MIPYLLIAAGGLLLATGGLVLAVQQPSAVSVSDGGPSINQDALYATFGAVAQTLAAVLAILIAIVVIRLPALETDVALADNVMRSIAPFSADYPRAREAFMSGGVEGLKAAKFEFDVTDENRVRHLRDAIARGGRGGSSSPLYGLHLFRRLSPSRRV